MKTLVLGIIFIILTITAMLFLKMQVVIFLSGQNTFMEIKKVEISMKTPENYLIKCFAQVKKITTNLFEKRVLHW